MKLGTIGTSWITEKFIDGAIKSKQFELFAVYSRDIKKAKILGKKFGNCEYFSDIDEMLKSDVEVVYIASPNFLHTKHIEMALNADKHVICEKPISIDLNELKRLYKLARSKEKFLLEAYKHVNCPAFTKVAELLKEVGTIRNISFSFSKYSSKYDDFLMGNNPNIFNPEIKAGALNDMGVYPLSFAYLLFGNPIDLKYTQLLLNNGADCGVSMILQYDTFLCNINSFKVCEGTLLNEISGENGVITIDNIGNPYQITLKRKNGEIIVYNIDLYENDMQHECEVFAEIINQNNIEKYLELTDLSIGVCGILDRINKENNK